MAASADNKAFGSKRGLRLWLVSAAWTRAAGASGWLFKAVGSLDKLNKMSWCHVTMSSSEPASGEKKKEASACYGKETVGIFAQARGRSMSRRLFEIDIAHNCSDVTVKSCRVYVCERTYGAFLVEERRQKTLHPNRSALVPCRSNTTIPIWLAPLSVQPWCISSLSLPILWWGRAIDIQNVSNSLAALTDWDLIFSRWSYSTLSKKQWRPRFTVELWNFFGVQILGIPGFVYKYPWINRALTLRLCLPPHMDLPRNLNEPLRVYTVKPKHLNSAWDWRRKLTKSLDIELNSWKSKMQRHIINVQVVTVQRSFWNF